MAAQDQYKYRPRENNVWFIQTLRHDSCCNIQSVKEQSKSIMNCLNKCELDVASNESETAEHSVHDGGGGREEGWKYISNYVGENVMKSPRICP